MKVLKSIRLDRFEREAIKRAAVHIRIAYPDHERGKDRRQQTHEDREVSALYVLGDGEAGRAMLERADRALTKLLRLCTEQSGVDYWRDALKPEVKPALAGSPPDQAAAVGLIAPGHDPCVVLAEARQMQAREAEAALEVVHEAMRHVPPWEDDE